MSNPYLGGAFAPVQQEYTLTELEVSGTIPEHLDGRYLRNGPNPIGEIDPALYHWFIGDAMVHGIRIRDKKAEWYRNRYVRGPQTVQALGEIPPPGRHVGLLPIGANTNVIGHAGRTIALIEGGISCYELTDALDTVGACDFDGTLPGGYAAHPKRDPDTDPPTLDRWTVDLAYGKVRESRLDDRAQEFSRVNERRLGKRYRFGYTPAVGERVPESTLLKHDLIGATTTTRSFGAGKQLGEFVFQPSEPESAEGDGVLMGFVYDPATDRSELAILDAQTMDTIASIHLPHRVAAGFHGN